MKVIMDISFSFLKYGWSYIKAKICGECNIYNKGVELVLKSSKGELERLRRQFLQLKENGDLSKTSYEKLCKQIDVKDKSYRFAITKDGYGYI